MHFLSLCLFSLTAVPLVIGRAVPDTHVLHEKRDVSIPSSAVKGSRLVRDAKLPMRIGLKQRNLETAEEWLLEVSNPASSKYGQHWTQDEVLESFRPHDDTIDAVMAWLTSSGIGRHRITHTDNKQWLAFDATTQEAEDLLHAQYHEYEHPNGHSMAGCDDYHIPKHLQSHIDFVTPGVKRSFIAPRTRTKRGFGKPSWGKPFGWHSPKHHPFPAMPPSYNKSSLATCDQAITPACLQALYNFKPQNPWARVSPNNSMGIFEEGDFYSQQDLNSFFTNFTSYIPNGTHPIPAFIDGAEAPVPVTEAGGESDLDFELAIPIIYPQTTTLYQTDDLYYAFGGNGTQTGIFNTFLDALDGSYCTYTTGNDPVLDPTYPDPNGYNGPLQCGVYTPTNIISISYGEQEADLPVPYQQRQCAEFLKLGLQGVSIFVASGDTGVGGYAGDPSPNGCLRNGTVFSPTQPNSCPYLTNVGATKVFPGRSVYEPESAVDDPAGHPYRSAYYSGGGFSNIFPIPSYQASAIDTYFSTSDPGYPYYYNGSYTNSTGIYNRNGRGIPDVAANGDNIAVYVEGDYGLSGGTSASSPIFAALMNRIVEERIRVGKGPVGFINPVLYEHPEVLNDIVNGSNPGCGTNGFSCAKGWDPVTGLGTPNYPKMLELFLSLP